MSDSTVHTVSFELAIQPDAGFLDGVRKPTRGTTCSAGHDFYSPIDTVVPAGQTVAIKTGITAKMPPGIVLVLMSRSGMALKGVTTEGGVIDADYYPNDIGVILKNSSTTDFVVKAGDRISQGLFLPYLVTEDSSDAVRTGGFGSTDTPKGEVMSSSY